MEKANALATRIGKDIANRNKSRLSHIYSKTSVKDLWAAVRQVTGRSQSTGVIAEISADIQHYTRVSSVADYQPPERKHTVVYDRQEFVSEWRVHGRAHMLLDKLPATASGMDQLPAWFLRIGALFLVSQLRVCLTCA